MKTYGLEEYKSFLRDRFGGVLEQGSHTPDGKACILESYSISQGIDWTDDPTKLRIWDIRRLNDILVDPKVRAEHIVPVLIAYQGSMDWPLKRQKAVASKLAILMVQRIVSELPYVSDDIRKQCRDAKTLKEAHDAAAVAARWSAAATARWSAAAAAAAARWSAAAAARWSAAAAADAAAAAAADAADAAREKFFIIACQCYLDAAKEG